MGWREVVVNSSCKISAASNYLIIRAEETKKIHLSEIHYLLIACPDVNITGVALCELARNKIKVVFCDEKHNPYGELVNYYGSCNCSKKIRQQIAWSEDVKTSVNTLIIYRKIVNQAALLAKYGFAERAETLYSYASEIALNDATNREGHAAKVYFNTLFGNGFAREIRTDENAALNYGYSIILSCINREVTANGYLTQLGINHRNEFNEFNLSCDIIEPFRVIADEYVYNHREKPFDKDYKFGLVDLLNKKVKLDKEYTLYNAIAESVRSILSCLTSGEVSGLKLYEFK